MKALFSSHFPAITPDPWIRDFEDLDVKPKVAPLINKGERGQAAGRRPAGARVAR